MAKTKREFMKAVFSASVSNARQSDKPLIESIKVIDKKTEQTIVDARFYMSSSANASTVYCAIWVHGLLSNEKLKIESEHPVFKFHTSGKGQAGGYGYHKLSAALQDALENAGISLIGCPYNREKKKTEVHIGGCGDKAMTDACLAIAYAAGCKDAIIV